jgi:hypothetical protein
MTIAELKAKILASVTGYPINRIILFGSHASGTNREDSDVDLLIEFTEPVTLFTLAKLQEALEDALQLDVDIVHGPLQSTDLLEINKQIMLY